MRACVLISLLSVCGCQAFNDNCTALVAKPEEEVLTLAAPVFLDRPNARTENNAIGQATADAFVDAMAPVAFAVVNSGSLRAEGLCGVTRNTVPKGVLTDQVLHEILLFENIVNAADVTGADVKAMFEHSAEGLFSDPLPIVSPTGAFLQVSKEVRLTIDCSLPAGSRVTSISIGSMPLSVTQTYRVALSSFLLAGGDGYTMLPNGKNPMQAQKLGGIDSNIASDFFKRTYRQPKLELAKDAARITFVRCTRPPPPP